jgi:pilus assembly protein FimV
MVTKLRVMIGMLLLAPALAHALGLGDVRLGSGLNQPLAAEVEIVGASPEDLLQLRVALPSRDMFSRYGVDRPAFLSNFTFNVGRDAAGRAVIQVRSTEPVTEPFVTFLIEATWPRGHLIREYTVLLDPPVFEAKNSQAPPIAAARTGESAAAAAGAVVRAPASAGESPPRAAASAASGAGASEYRVQPNDSLSAIVRRSGVSSKADVDRAMLSTFRANPSAFDGNINRLHKGALLKLPGADEWGALGVAEAEREVGRQMADWHPSAAGAHAAGDEARLRLVPPAEPGKGQGGGAAPAPAGESQRVAALEKELAESKRLLELKSAELARLEAQAKPGTAVPPPVAPPVTAPVAPKPEAVKPTPPQAEPAKPETAAPAAVTPAVTPPPAKPKAVPVETPPEPGFFSTLTDNPLYLILGAAVVLLAGLFGYNVVRRRRSEAGIDDAFAPAASQPSAPAGDHEDDHAAMVVEESDDDSGEFVQPARAKAAAPAAAPAAATSSIEDTISSETSLNLEQADPLAEADFHMAYGLYDQAADIVKLAIGREPARRDLKLKLLEVYFVWGNKDAFLEVARDLNRTRDAAPAGEWDKVVIMGRQIAGDDAMFAGAAAAAPSTDVDVDLEAGGAQSVDLELLGDSPSAPASLQHDDFVDLDLGQALAGADSTADTGESKTLDPDRLDLMLEGESADHDHGGGTTREMRPQVDSPTVEQPALRASEAPTVETPMMAGNDQTIRDKLDSALKRSPVAADATAELSLDDLGFEIDKLGSTSTSLEALQVTDHPSDAPTMVAGLDEGTRAMLAAAEKGLKSSDLEPTRETPRPADRTARMATMAPEETGTTRALGSDLDLDLDELARALESDTVEQPKRDELKFSTDVFATAIRKPGEGLDLDVGALHDEATDLTSTAKVKSEDLALPDLEPVTLSEVGTKLDLARAYMDMGDPDGARSILQEVLTEGSASQKQEAQRLIDTLPG